MVVKFLLPRETFPDPFSQTDFLFILSPVSDTANGTWVSKRKINIYIKIPDLRGFTFSSGAVHEMEENMKNNIYNNKVIILYVRR